MVAEIPADHPPYPLHPSVRDRLHPDYVSFYNKYLLYQTPTHYRSIESSRQGVPVSNSCTTNPNPKPNRIPGESAPLPVGSIKDFSVPRRETAGPEIPIRCFTPGGEAPVEGWPLVLYFHGGGWVFGDIGSENTLCSHMCARARSVVITVDYRLAPEDPYPAAIHDAWESYMWATSSQGGARLLNLNVSKVAVAGASAGANIAAVLAQNAMLRHAHNQEVSLRSQILVVPITDNTATPCSSHNPSWKEFEFTAALPAKKMLWYRNHYLPDQSDWAQREASPLLASDEIFKLLPRANILVGELDVLRYEGEEYARRLSENGVAAEVTIMEGMPHPFLALDGVLEAGRRAITIVCDELIRVFA